METEQEPPLILVADDVPANVELLFDQLQTLGFRTIAAVDGPTAIAACVEHHPDLCILDVAMPAGDLGVDHRSTGFRSLPQDQARPAHGADSRDLRDGAQRHD